VDLKIIEQLLALMDEGGLTELHYVHGETEVRLSRQPSAQAPQVVYAGAPAMAAPAAAPAATPAAAPAAEPIDDADYFRSPMVGTFYRKANPESGNYVDPGDSFGEESVVCIIEAMKVFNEIKAECSGTVVEFLVEDGEAVEYDQPLFRIKR
jgi:acetyl-CoA carboxylase biotin carboxyl carrier protein